MAERLALLDPRRVLPLSTRLDTAQWLHDVLESSTCRLSWDETAQLMEVVIPALLLSTADELGEAMVGVLRLLLHAAAAPADAKTLALQHAEAQLQAAGTAAAGVQLPALFSLLALVLDGEAAAAAANALPERRQLVQALVRGMDPSTPAIAPARASQHQLTFDPAPAPDAGACDGLCAASLRIFLRLVQTHGASPSSVLLRCDVPLHSLLRLLPSTTSRSARPPPLELLELYTELATDESLAVAMCSPPLLPALKPPLLSGAAPLQLATVDLLLELRQAPDGIAALCDDGFVPFLIELCRLDTHEVGECAAALRLRVRRLLAPLLAHEQAGASSMCSRLLDAFHSGSKQPPNGAGRQPFGAGRAQAGLQAGPTGGFASTLPGVPPARPHAPSDDANKLRRLEVACARSLLSWYTPSARETLRLAQFCTRVVPPILASIPWPESHAGPSPPAADSPWPGLDENVARTLLSVAALLRTSAFHSSPDPPSSDALMRLLCAPDILHPYLDATPLLLRQLPDLGVEIAIEIAEVIAELLSSSLGAPTRRAFGRAITAEIIVLLRHMTDPSSGAEEEDARGIEARSASTRLSLALLHALGRLPPPSGPSSHPHGSYALPAALGDCCGVLGTYSRLAASGTMQGTDAPPAALLEWILLHLQYHFGIRGEIGGPRAEAGRGGGRGVLRGESQCYRGESQCYGGESQPAQLSSSPPPPSAPLAVPHDDATAALCALEGYLTGQAERLHELLPPSTLRRVATIWARHSTAVDAASAANAGLVHDAYVGGGYFGEADPDESETEGEDGGGHAGGGRADETPHTLASVALGRALLRLPAEQSLGLPLEAIRWLWGQRVLHDEAAAVLVEWAMLQHARPAAVDGGAPAAAGPVAPPPTCLASVCVVSEHAPALLVSLLSDRLHATHSRHGGAHAVLSLIWAAAGGGGGGGGSGADEEAVGRFFGGLMSSGLACALGKLSLLLPSDESHAAEHRLLVQLMTREMLRSPSPSHGLHPHGQPHDDDETQMELGGTGTHDGVASAAELNSALHHASAALLREARAAAPCAPGHTPRHGLRTDLLNFSTVALALHDDALDAIASSAPLLSALASFAADGAPPHAPLPSSRLPTFSAPSATPMAAAAAPTTAPPATAHPQPFDERPASAAAALLLLLLRRLAPDAERPPQPNNPAPPTHSAIATSSTRARVLEQLQASLPLGALLPGVRSRLPLRCAATLHLAAELCAAGALSSANPPAPQHAEPSPHPSPHKRPRHEGSQPPPPTDEPLRSHSSAWGPGLVSALINTSLRREPCVLAGLSLLVDTLASSSPTDLDRLASHPWNAFALEVGCGDWAQGGIGRGAAAYWAAILKRRPEWTHSFVLRKPDLVRELVGHLVHASPFTAAHVALLRALQSVSALAPPLVAEATQLLQLRAREPSAARWTRRGLTGGGAEGGEGDGGDDADERAPLGAPCGRAGGVDFSDVGGVIVPAPLLRLPGSGRARGGAARLSGAGLLWGGAAAAQGQGGSGSAGTGSTDTGRWLGLRSRRGEVALATAGAGGGGGGNRGAEDHDDELVREAERVLRMY